MTTTFTADSLQKQFRRDTKHEIFAFVEENSVGTTKHFKSDVWKTFKLMKVVASGLIIPILCCCHKCENVLSYNAKRGTSHLKRHVDACITKKVTGAMNQYLNKTVTLTNAEKDSLKLLQMKHVVFGHHSFNSTDEPDVVALLQGMVDLGSKHGKFDIKPHLFGRNTVGSCLKWEVTEVTSKIADIISEPAASDCVSLTCGMWSDDYQKLSYIDVNAFWITKEFVMKNTLLGLKHFTSEVRVTTPPTLQWQLIPFCRSINLRLGI